MSIRRNTSIKYFSWKDLNTAMDLVAYKKRIRLYECDEFTREYLTSEGIEGLGRTSYIQITILYCQWFVYKNHFNLKNDLFPVNPNELPPKDFYTASRNFQLKTYKSPRYLWTHLRLIFFYFFISDEDPLRKFLTLDRVVLRFWAIWDEREQLYGEVRKFLAQFDIFRKHEWFSLKLL